MVWNDGIPVPIVNRIRFCLTNMSDVLDASLNAKTVDE